MAVAIALLRGINVGAHNRIAMPALREHLTELGYGAVRSYIASGNLVLESTAKPAELEKDLQQAIADGFGVDTPVVVRTATQLVKVIEDNPFSDAGGKALHVLFLSERCPEPAAQALTAAELDPEDVRVAGREVYCHYANGMQNSPLGKLLGKQLPRMGTDRTWNTVLKLAELAEDA